MNPIKLQKLDRRIPKWNLKKLAERKCPFCKSPGIPAFIRPDNLQVNSCQECHSYFVGPAPDQVQLDAFYASYDAEHRNEAFVSSKQLLYQYQQTDPMDDRRFQVITSLIDVASKQVLDIGFGRGFFLYFLKEMGANVFGIEPDADAIRYASKDLGIPSVRQIGVGELGDNERYDLILLMDLIEHLLNPGDALAKLSSLLNPGGYLVIWTPNAGHAVGKQAPVTFRVDLEHMQYLSASTCNFLSRELGLEIAHLEQGGSPWLVGLIEEEAQPLPVRIKKSIARLPGVERSYAYYKKATGKDRFRSGDYHLFCIYKKKPA